MNFSLRRIVVLCLVLALGLAALMALRAPRSPRIDEPGAPAPSARPEPGTPNALATPPLGREGIEPSRVPLATQELRAMPRPGFVQARFVDEQGNPVAGVELSSRMPSGMTRSAADGSARLELAALELGSERVLSFEARHPAFARDTRQVRGAAEGRLLLGDWRLVAAGVVEGRVVDEAGLGLAGVQVACARDDLPESEWAREVRMGLELVARPGARATSAADGAFRLEELPAGPVRLVAACADRPAARSQSVDVPRGGIARDVRIVLAAADVGTRISGIVLDPARQSVPHARLVVRAPRQELQTFAGPDGRFEIPCEDHELRDVLALDPEQRLREAVQRGIRPGTSGLELELRAAPEVEVRVLSEKGVPIERFALVVLALERSLPLAFFAEAERPGGRAWFGAPAQAFRLEVRANGWRPARSDAFTADAPPADVELRLAPAGGLRGRVTAAGAPVGGARVTLHALEDRRATFNGFPLRLQPEPVAETESDAEGRYALSVAEPGAYHVLVEAQGFALAERGPFPLAPEAEREEPVELDAGGRLEVQLRASEPAAAAGVRVAFSRGDGCAFTERTDEHGRIALELLTPGPWQVERTEADIDPRFGPTQLGVRGAERIPSNCSVHAGETTRLELWLDEDPEHTCRLTGRLVLDGAPAAGFLAALDHAGTGVGAEQAFDEPGLFRLALDEPGTYRLRLSADTVDPAAMLVLLETIELGPGEQHWSLELSTGALEGTLSGAGESALVFHRWQRGALTCLVPLVPGPDGRLPATRVPAGQGEIVRFDPARPLGEQSPERLHSLTIDPGGTTKVEL